LAKLTGESDVAFEKRKTDLVRHETEVYYKEPKPFAEFWYPNYWLVFVYMAKPTRRNAHTAFYTTPIRELSSVFSCSGKANRRLANVLASNFTGNDTSSSRDISTISNKAIIDSDFKISLLPNQHDIKSLDSGKKIFQMNLSNEKLDQLERLEGFLAKIEAKGSEIYSSTIEATKRNINDLITMKYVNAENEEDEEKDNLIITTETFTRQRPVDDEKLEIQELEAHQTVNLQSNDTSSRCKGPATDRRAKELKTRR
jgi:hypothetical protein